MIKKNKKTRGIALLSGGLDSILAVKILQEQGIEITGIVFVSCFFKSDFAEKAAKQLKIKLRIIDFSKDHLKMVKNPEYGRGKSANPCVDCHLMMIKKTGEFFKKEKFDFVSTGEILGQRPFSQNKQAMELIERKSGIKGYLLRPLSAKLLEETIPEKEKKVDRGKLLAISGRNRKKQIVLAKEWKIKEYPSPSGGCILTDLVFGKKIKELFQKWPDCNEADIEILKIGRHFWKKNNLIIVGRNKEENFKINKLKQKKDIIVEPKEFPGPTVLIRSKDRIIEDSLIQAKDLIMKYSKRSS